MGRKAVTRDNVKTTSRQQHDSRSYCVLAARSTLFENVDFTSDIEIVSAGSQARVHHLPGGLREGTGAVQYGNHLSQGTIQLISVLQVEHLKREIQAVGNCL